MTLLGLSLDCTLNVANESMYVINPQKLSPFDIETVPDSHAHKGTAEQGS